jgi:hypothetical protein
MGMPDDVSESLVLGCLQHSPRSTLTELFQANERLGRAVGVEDDPEATRWMNDALEHAVDRLVDRGLVAKDVNTYSLTPLGEAEAERRHEAGVAARAKQGSTEAARKHVLALLGSSGTFDELMTRSKDEDGFGFEEDWARLNLDELVARGEVVQEGGRYRPS